MGYLTWNAIRRLELSHSIHQGGASWESYHPSGQSQAILDMCGLVLLLFQ